MKPKRKPKPPTDHPLPDDHAMLLPVAEQKHRFTAERVKKNTERYESIKRALACGVPVKTICEIFKVSHHTVCVISDREPQLVATGKKRLADKFRYGALLALESALDDVASGKMPSASLPVFAGICADKSRQLEGEATMVVEHRQVADPGELLRRAEAALGGEITDAKGLERKSEGEPT